MPYVTARSRWCNQVATRKIWARSVTLTSWQPSNDPGRYSSTGGISRAAPSGEYRQDTVSALAGARQVVLSDHEEYLIIQTLQFLSPHFQVANLQSTESRHLRGQSVFSGLFIQRPKGLKSAFMFLEGERNRRTGIPPPRLGTTQRLTRGEAAASSHDIYVLIYVPNTNNFLTTIEL